MKKESLNRKEIMQLITPVVQNVCVKYGLIPLEIDFVKESGRWFLRVFIFSNDHPINHKDCENMTNGLGDYLDELIPFVYHIEISSPGAERKLKSTMEYEIFKGKKLKLKLKQPLEEGQDKIIFGHIVEFQKNIGLKLKLEKTNQEIIIEESNISSANLCLE